MRGWVTLQRGVTTGWSGVDNQFALNAYTPTTDSHDIMWCFGKLRAPLEKLTGVLLPTCAGCGSSYVLLVLY